VMALAKKAEQSLRMYCAARDVNHSTVCKWKGKRKGTVFLSILEKLNGPPKRTATKQG
jgi:hypothetical protein